MAKAPYPIAVLDIETERVRSWSRTALNAEQPLLIGLLIAHSPTKVIYRSFSRREYARLDAILSDFTGPILTYNGLRFDFFILEKQINVKKLLRHSIDLYYWLQSKIGRVKGSTLGKLSQENLGVGKNGSWELGIQSWHKGNKAPMRRYNKMDCKLPLMLFMKLLNQGHLLFQGKKIESTAKDLKCFMGRLPQVQYDLWLTSPQFSRAQKIKEAFEDSEDGYWEAMLEAMGYEPGEIAEFGVNQLLRSLSGVEYVSCLCGKYFEIGWTEWPGFRDVRPIHCPNCNKRLGNHDCDYVSEIQSAEYFLNGMRLCPSDHASLKHVKHVIYKPGTEEWDTYRCPKCRKNYQIAGCKT